MKNIEEYLEQVTSLQGDSFGLMVRRQFSDILSGASELAALACPTQQEAEDLRKAVAIMTESEKKDAENLGDEKIRAISEDAGIDEALLSIFINGYALYCKRVRGSEPRN
ncbi:hypothetical protein [Sedimentisphaera salicampi]|uniref:Uncharacterized protein n=1 Tax=Sedimentisphaera salicampi TaxID=1941349 RepID=A0A1W6LIX9_9BACT|nr:hypothetical protein [Sedimentisphaera salicampi]ARN55693.1 hypothetical protein STSP1_00056 [Sedimentisphaera salicampi]OXU16211.1 hypothetical protein SMSP1_00055 [Sedimentisphaera salicampi]